MNSIDVLIQVFVFTAVYFLIRQPSVDYAGFFLPYVLVCYVASGWGYFISTIVPPQHGPFIVSLVMFVSCGLLGNPQNLDLFLDGSWMETGVSSFSITRWSIGMSCSVVVESLKELEPGWQPSDSSKIALYQLQSRVFSKGAWSVGSWWTAIGVLLIMGTVMRILGFLGLFCRNRQKAA